MKNENEITDKTYTLNSVTSYFHREGINLKLLLPQEEIGNPYEYKVFDVSQVSNGTHYNALFIYMKKANTDVPPDLSSYDDDKCECDFLYDYSNIIQLDNLEGFSPFNYEADNALITVYHDSEPDSIYQQTCAEKVFSEVTTFTASVIANGNFQTEMALMGGDPKKMGMSFFPKK